MLNVMLNHGIRKLPALFKVISKCFKTRRGCPAAQSGKSGLLYASLTSNTENKAVTSVSSKD